MYKECTPLFAIQRMFEHRKDDINTAIKILWSGNYRVVALELYHHLVRHTKNKANGAHLVEAIQI